MIEDNRTTKRIVRPLTKEDLNRYRDELAITVQRIGDTESAKATATAQYGGQLKELKKQLNEISRKINERREEKDVDCFWAYRWSIGRKELIVEEDREVLEKADITDKEYQIHKTEEEEQRQTKLALEEIQQKEPEQWYRNEYLCPNPNCNSTWTDEWTAMSDDSCPFCGKENVSPVSSVPIEAPDEANEPDASTDSDVEAAEPTALDVMNTGHLGDPCEFCGKLADEMEKGPCPGRIVDAEMPEASNLEKSCTGGILVEGEYPIDGDGTGEALPEIEPGQEAAQPMVPYGWTGKSEALPEIHEPTWPGSGTNEPVSIPDEHPNLENCRCGVPGGFIPPQEPAQPTEHTPKEPAPAPAPAMEKAKRKHTKRAAK